MPIKPTKTRIIAVKLDGSSELHITQANEWEIHGGTPAQHERLGRRIQETITKLASEGKTLETATIQEIEATFSNLEKGADTP